jgi:hypothetical protein
MAAAPKAIKPLEEPPEEPPAVEPDPPEPPTPPTPTGPLGLVFEGQEGLVIHLSSSGGVRPVTFDFGDGTTHEPADGFSTAHTYARPGRYSITLSDAADGFDQGLIMVAGNIFTVDRLP